MARSRVIRGVNDLENYVISNNMKYLLDEWDYVKNNPLKPKDVTAHSSRKVYWKCAQGHSWMAMISSRTAKRGCPFCSGNRLSEKNCLAILYPEIAKEWNYEKNKTLTPNDVMYGSNKRVWWKCENGHEWEATINARTNSKTGCPYCSGRRVTSSNNLEVLYPSIAKEWNFKKNKILPSQVKPKSNKKVWWICPRGHEYESVIGSRVIGYGCPQCNMTATSFPEQAILFYVKRIYPNTKSRDRNAIGKELDIYIPDINVAIEYDGQHWHGRERTLKTEFEKDSLCKEKGIRLIRVIEKGVDTKHDEFVTCIYRESNTIQGLEQAIKGLFLILGIVTPINLINDEQEIKEAYYYGVKQESLANLEPEIAVQWNYKKNGKLLPEQFSVYSSQRVWWICDKGHEWKATISHRTYRKDGCPYCSNKKLLPGHNDLGTVNPSLALEWNFEKNALTPKDVLPSSSRKVWWKCHRGHEWEATINNRARGKNCPYCLSRYISTDNCLLTTNPELLEEWNYEKNREIRPEDVSAGSHHKVWWKCRTCGYEWETVISVRAKQGCGCPSCAKKMRVIQKEKTLISNGAKTLAGVNPPYLSEWMYSKNTELDPTKILYKSNKRAWWKCRTCGYEWESQINNRAQGRGCPKCAQSKRNESKKETLLKRRNLRDNCPDIVIDWHPNKNTLLPEQVTYGTNTKVWWKCHRCGYEWEDSVAHVTSGRGCKKCRNSQKNK